MGSSAECWGRPGCETSCPSHTVGAGWESPSKPARFGALQRCLSQGRVSQEGQGEDELSSASQPTSACSAARRSQDSGDVLVLVDSEDDDYEEEKGEEDAVSSSKYELVNGSSAPAAYLSCLAEGEPCCLLWGQSCEAVGFWKAASGEGGTPVLTSLALAEVLLLCR